MIDRRSKLGPPAAADYTGSSVSTLAKLRMTGDGPAYIKLGPRKIVYDPDDLDRWLTSRRRTSTSDPGPAAEQ